MREIVILLEDFCTKLRELIEVYNQQEQPDTSDTCVLEAEKQELLAQFTELLSEKDVKSVAIFTNSENSGVKSIVKSFDGNHVKIGELLSYLSTKDGMATVIKSHIEREYQDDTYSLQQFLAGYQKNITAEEPEEIGYVTPTAAYMANKLRNMR